jgi:hypothetical protein
MQTHIAIPVERYEQLKLYATSRKISVADAVGVLINDAVAAGKIPNVVPGFRIERNGEVISIEAIGAFVRKLNREAATEYADRIHAMLKPMITPAADNPFVPTFDVIRRGSGVKLIDPETGAERAVSPSVALDVARLISEAAAETL